MRPELKMTTPAREQRVRRAAKSVWTTTGCGARVRKDPRTGQYSLIDLYTNALIADDLDLESLEESVGCGARWNEKLVVPGTEVMVELRDVLQAVYGDGDVSVAAHRVIEIEFSAIDAAAFTSEELAGFGDVDVWVTIHLSGDYPALLEHLRTEYATELTEQAAYEAKRDAEHGKKYACGEAAR